MLRSENASPLISPDQSRRQSLLVPTKDGEAHREKPAVMGGLDDDGGGENNDNDDSNNRGGPGSLRSTESQLQQSIMDLDAFSTHAAQTLNDTCDAMQDKMASLQEIVLALKQLAEASRDIHDGFNRVSNEIECDITRQLDALGQFRGQQDTIENLQTRIHRERRRIESLSARVEVVRQRVEGWEEADRAWQEKTRKRLTIVWTALTVFAVVFLGLLIFVEYNREARGGDDAAANSSRMEAEVEVKADIPGINMRIPDVVEEDARRPETANPRVRKQHDDANSSMALPAEKEELVPENDSGADRTSSGPKSDDGEEKTQSEPKLVCKTPANDQGWPRAFDEL